MPIEVLPIEVPGTLFRWAGLSSLSVLAQAIEEYRAADVLRPIEVPDVLRPIEVPGTLFPLFRLAWGEAYSAFVAAYRAALHALREGWEAAGFPEEGCRPAVLLPEAGG